MANNRLYFYCKGCGKATTLAKTMGDGYYNGDHDLNPFFERHNTHNEEDGFGTNFYGLIEEQDKKVTKVGFRDENGDLDLGLSVNENIL